MFLYLFIHFTYSYFWKNRPAFTFHSKCVTATLNFELIYLNVYFDCYSFFQLIWFILNTGMTFLFWNHSIIAQHVFTSTQSASPRDLSFELYLCFFIIHSFIHLFIFFLLLFICFTLFNYITKYDISVLKSFNNSPALYLLPLKVPHRKIEFWIVFMLFIIHSFTYSYFFFTIIYLFHLI